MAAFSLFATNFLHQVKVLTLLTDILLLCPCFSRNILCSNAPNNLRCISFFAIYYPCSFVNERLLFSDDLHFLDGVVAGMLLKFRSYDHILRFKTRRSAVTKVYPGDIGYNGFDAGIINDGFWSWMNSL